MILLIKKWTLLYFCLWNVIKAAQAICTVKENEEMCRKFNAVECDCRLDNATTVRVSCGPRAKLAKLKRGMQLDDFKCPIHQWVFKSIKELVIPWKMVSNYHCPIYELKLSDSELACSCWNAWLVWHDFLRSTIIHDEESLCPNCTFSLSQWTYMALPPKVTINGQDITEFEGLVSHCPNAENNKASGIKAYLEHNCDIPKLTVHANSTEVKCATGSSTGCLQGKVLPYFGHLIDHASLLNTKISKLSLGCAKVMNWNLTDVPKEDSGWVECSIKSDTMPIVQLIDTLNVKYNDTAELIRWQETCNLPKSYSVDFTIVSRPIARLHWFRIIKGTPVLTTPTIVHSVNKSEPMARILLFPDPHYASGLEGGWSVASGRIKFLAPDKHCTSGTYLLLACPPSEDSDLFASGLPAFNFTTNCLSKTFIVCSEGQLEACRDLIHVPKENLSPPTSPLEENQTDMVHKFSLFSIIGILIGAIVLFTGCVLLLAVYYKWSQMKKRPILRDGSMRGLDRFRTSDETIPLSGVGVNEHYMATAATSLQLESVTHINQNELVSIKLIGEGAFGEVFLVQYKPRKVSAYNATKTGSLHDGMHLAMKQLKYVTSEKLGDVEREASLLKALDHPNIVKFYGISTQGKGLALLFEYMENGDLVKFLRDHNVDLAPDAQMLENKELLRMALQVCSGLEYLHSLHLVHRDLAARNCLVGEDLTVKLSDFGMTRDIYVCDYYKVGAEALVPLRWLPPESMLYRKFTPESDIWSFGVLLWEIFSFGQVPWYQYSNVEVLEVVKEGRPMKKPSTCPENIYKDLILKCWKINPSQRFTAQQLKQKLETLLELSVRYTKLVSVEGRLPSRASMGVLPMLRNSFDSDLMQTIQRKYSDGSEPNKVKPFL